MPDRTSSLSLHPTRQEQASGFLSATLLILGLLTLFMLVTWLTQRTSDAPATTRVALRAEHGQGSGSLGDAEIFRPLDFQQTEDLPVTMEAAAEKLQLISSLAATELDGGLKGKGFGVEEGDRRQKGPENTDSSVVPNWQRWQIRYAAADIQEYAAILDAFGVELGVMGGGVQTIDYARDLSQALPKTRSGQPQHEKRLRFALERGELQEADRALAQKAHLSTSGRVVCQFFPDSVKQQLQLLEREALGTRPLSSVRFTQFGIRRGSRGLEFFVLRVESPITPSGLSPL